MSYSRLRYFQKVNSVTAANPMYDILHKCLAKKFVPDDIRDLNKEILTGDKRNLSFDTKRTIMHMQHNAAVVDRHTYICKECSLEFPSRELMAMHAYVHIKQEGQEIESHVY